MRRAVTPAIPPKAYRHFAIITLALTTALAMFAEGETHEAQAVEVNQREPAKPEAPAFAAPAARSGRAPIGWNDDFSDHGDFGRPMESLSGSSSSVIPEEVTESLAPHGATALTQAERELLLQRMRQGIRPAPAAQN